ncbi:DNRLRE domain-containing protein [Streptomyces sp. NPDC001634]|uniref:DNRLRE domain-containing protein n=1 Tax=Streptomyces sp. NPDC001634 TaxID=3154390 RepID=UPI0033231943
MAVSAVFATGIPQSASAAEHAVAVQASTSGSGPHHGSNYSWWDPRSWFKDDDKSVKAESTTFKWSRPKGRSTPRVHVDPHARRIAELTRRRTANESFYRLSDGRVQEVVSAVPLHYRDAHGAWQTIRTAVRPVSHGAFSVGSEANAFHSYFSGRASSLVRIEQGSSFVQLAADGAHTRAPKVSGDTVAYPGALPGADLRYQVEPGGLKESIVLAKAPTAATAYSFTLKVSGFTPRQRRDGSIALTGGEAGRTAFVIPAPYMSDSRADASSPYGTAYSTKVSQSMRWDAKSGMLRITIRPNASWLADTHRRYPVVIDPTILVAPTPSQASNVMISSDGPATNYGTSWRLSVGTTATGASRALIKFPLPSVPAGTTITSASLNLYYDQTHTTAANAVPLEAHAATAAWDPTTATWNSANGITGALAGTATKAAYTQDVWNSYSVTSTVQGWLNGTSPNYGFVVKAANESALSQGGPRYEGSIYSYGGETANYPQLVVTYGVPGVTLNPPSVIHSTGAELSWNTYTNNTGSSANDIVEYQVHRSVYQTFTPSASTEVAPVAAGTTSFVDTTAQPTPTSSSDPYGNAYYYMVVVKTASGALIPAPTQLVRLPKAGLTTVILRGGSATTLSSAKPTTVLNTLSDGTSSVPQQWLEVGDNSSTYGNARTVFDFGALPSTIPSTATIMDAHLKVWQEQTTTGTSGAVYELHALNRSFTQSQATWNNANSTTAWTTAGGDYNATADGTISGLTNDPNRQKFDATAIVQGWVNTPSSNHGLEVKLASEVSTAPQERTLFAGPNTAEPALAPQLVVTYLDATTDSTYYAPITPTKMVPGTTYTVPVTINNTTSSTWSASNEQLTYHWTLPDGTDVTNTSNQLATALPSDMTPGAQQTLNAQVTPPTPTDTNAKGAFTLAWDMKNTSTGSYLSNSGGIGSLSQATGVEEPGSNQLGLEKFYQYTTRATGAGSALYTNDSSGNTVWNYNAFSNPSRGFATFARMSYNSLDTTDSTLGYGWSLQTSTPTRLGTPLDFHPNPNPTEVTMTDGDGTSHVWTWNSSTSTWTSPPGVHLYLQQLASCGPQITNSRAWEMTRPDRTQFFYDCEGFPTAVVDKNGNEADFTYSSRKSENKPEEFLSYITDPTGRKTLTVNYYNKGDNYSYIDSTGNLVSDTNLTNPKIIDHIKSLVDISGREIDFYYTTQGLMARMVDGAGNSAAKTFNFTYDATQGNKNVKLTQVTDPRGHATQISYYDPSTDPKFHWWTQNVTDRLNHTTGFSYTEPGAISGAQVQTAITDADNHTTTNQVDSTGRLIQSVNALNQKTTLAWDADNNVTSLTEDNGAQTTWTYDPNTGYPLSKKDALANKNNTAAETYTYQTSLSGHIADITDKTSPAGRHWHFAYDTNGNLTSVQDPNGTKAGSGYTTSYTYDATGELLTATDANNHTTTYSNYDPSGYPDTSKDPLGNTTTAVYGPRGEVTSATDALGHTTTQNYDVFGRPLDGKTPKDQANGVYITTPAPVYDANDNITQKTAPNGAVSTAVYDANDQATSSTLPQDTSTSPTRTTTYTYDAVGNQLTVTTPDGNVSGAQAGSYTTTTAYDAANEPVTVTNAAGKKTTTSYDDVGNKTQVTDPLTHTTKTAYDLDHRPTTVTDAANYTTSTAYDLDGAQISTTDQNGNTTLYTNDQDGRVTQVQVPHTSSGGTITYDTTQYQYDQVGNKTATISPRGVASGIANAYTTKTSYDADNRKSAEFGAYNPNDSTYNTAPETDYSYDAAGRLTKVTAPPSGGSTVNSVTTTSFWDNGWTKSSTDPWGITTSYDYNALGKQTSRTITSAGGSSSRTQGWGYYPDGKLQSHTDNGVPVGLQVEMVDNSDAQNTGSTGTWSAATNGTGYQGYNYRTHAAGSGTDAFTWNLSIPEDGTYQVYAQFPGVTGAATTAQYTINYNGGSATSTVDQTKNTGTWVSLGSYSFTQAGTGQKISLAQNAGGTVVADAIKVVRNNSGDTQPNPKSFTYTYDPNGSLTDLADNSPGAQFNDYAYTYDGLSRLTQLQEKLSGTVKHTTGFTYDDAGNPLSETHDASSASYTFDVRNLLSQVVNKETSTDSGKTTSYTYTPALKVATETKANGNVVTNAYNLDNSLAGSVEKTSGGTVVAQHTLTYDPNGNQTQDVSVTQNADNSSASLNRTATDTYTPRDQVASVTNSDGNNNQSYTYDLAGNITSQTVGGTTTTNVYDRNRLLTATAGGTTADYNYDPFGRTDTVTAVGTVINRYTYDGFDHIASEAKYTGSGTVTTNYTYDPFDRTVSQTDNAGSSNAKTTNFDYLATSKSLADESVGGTVTKSYQYASTGERLDQIVHNTDGTETPTYYTYNAHTDVQAITGANGNTTATYGYTAYGKDDTSQDTGVDKGTGTGATGTTAATPYNVYRFNSKRIDGDTGNYDMGFRNYDPSMNRFLTRDMYEGALADSGMTTDPFTGNRYAFGGGNPLSNIEVDGHMLIDDNGCSGTVAGIEACEARQDSSQSGTAPGAGKYYTNDTPITIPTENKEDYRPYDSSSWWQDLLDMDHDQDLLDIMSVGSEALRHGYGYTDAANLLDHWLDGSGTAYQIDPKKMMNDVGGFKAKVDEAVAKGLASGDGNFNTGWQSSSVARNEKEHGDKGPAVQNWWYALNGYQYDVSGTSTAVDGTTVETITVNVFKRYNWGNVAGGEPRGNVGPGHLIEQNDLAQLNADGMAQDYNVWGSYSYTLGG